MIPVVAYLLEEPCFPEAACHQEVAYHHQEVAYHRQEEAYLLVLAFPLMLEFLGVASFPAQTHPSFRGVAVSYPSPEFADLLTASPGLECGSSGLALQMADLARVVSF